MPDFKISSELFNNCLISFDKYVLLDVTDMSQIAVVTVGPDLLRFRS